MNEQKKKQTMRYTDEELRLIKNTFAEADDILKVIRKVILQMTLTGVDLAILQLIKEEGVLRILRKTMLPTLDPEAPLNQVIDLWMTVQIMDKTPDEAYPHLLAREKLIRYLDQQLKRLENPEETAKIKFDKLTEIKKKNSLEVYCDLIVRNTIITHTEQQLNQLKILAGLKEETEEQTLERLKKDSVK